MLSVSGLDVSIKSIRILRGVALRVEDRQLVGLVGRNGAGKTTLMRTIMGLLPPTAGTLELGGKSLAAASPYARARMGVGYMPEDRRIVPQLSVEENVILPAWASGVKDKGYGRLAQIYRMIPEVEALKERKGFQLSGGQQKLVALARALMSGTQLLLLDEPFEGVAPVLARRLGEVIGALRTEGLSVLLSESDLSHSRELIDVVYTIDRGAIGAPGAASARAVPPAGGPP